MITFSFFTFGVYSLAVAVGVSQLASLRQHVRRIPYGVRLVRSSTAVSQVAMANFYDGGKTSPADCVSGC